MSVYQDLTTAIPPVAPKSSKGVPFWGDSPQAWDRAYLNGQRLPGAAEVTGSGLGRRWDKVKTPGGKGASFVVLGFEPAQFTITLQLWTPEHLRELEQFARILRPTATARGKFSPSDAVSVDHPTLAFYNIRSAIIMKPAFLVPKGKQIFEMSIDFEEYFNQDKIGGTGTTGVGIVKSKAPPITTLGPGAIGRKIPQTPPEVTKPSKNNAGP